MSPKNPSNQSQRKRRAEGVEYIENTFDTEVYVKRIAPFTRFLQKKDDLMLLYGGAGSGKTVAIGQKVCQKFIEEENIDILVTRKTRPSLVIPKAPWPLIRSTLSNWGVGGVKKNEQKLTLTRKKNSILFKAVDDPEKIKSSEYDYIWAEEATDFSKDDFLMIQMRLGRSEATPFPQMWMSFNPIDVSHWLIKEYINKPGQPGVAIMHSDHRTNPFLSMRYRNRLEGLKSQSKNKYDVYARGKPGVLEHIIYTNWEVLPFKQWPARIREREPDKGGMDFGTEDPRVLLSGWRDEGTWYVHQEFYRTGTTNNDMISWMGTERKYPRTTPIYADPSRKDSIQDIDSAGFVIYKANNAIKDGIEFVMSKHIIYSETSVEIVEEAEGYCRRVDRKGRVLDEPVDYKNHGMDALRYMIFTERDENDTVLPEPDTNDAISQMPVFFKSKGIPHM